MPQYGITSLYLCAKNQLYRIMTIQEIYDSWALSRIEYAILDLHRQSEKGIWGHETARVAIHELLEQRKYILDDMFEENDYHKQLLTELNEAIKLQMIEVRQRTINLYESVVKANLPGSVEVTGKCYLGFNYPKLHPIQDERAKKMWNILNGCEDRYMPLYDDGLGQYQIRSYDPPVPDYESVNKMLYLEDEPFNCNDGLDREWTKDMMITYQFHELYDHMEFSIFDLLWVRDFEIELNVEIDDFHVYEGDDE